VANANKLNSTVYFFFGVFLGLTALVFFGDLVAFIPGLAASFFAAAGFLAFGFAAFFSAAGFFAAVFLGVLAFLDLAAFGFTAFFGLAAGFLNIHADEYHTFTNTNVKEQSIVQLLSFLM
jgi:drug/metabolite transporter (DMT)-like permease